MPHPYYPLVLAACPWPGCEVRIEMVDFRLELAPDKSLYARVMLAWASQPNYGLVARCPGADNTCGSTRTADARSPICHPVASTCSLMTGTSPRISCKRMGGMNISSRTPEGEPNHCPVCGSEVRTEPSRPLGDAPCPVCGTLLWFKQAAGEFKQAAVETWFYEAAKLGPIFDALR